MSRAILPFGVAISMDSRTNHSKEVSRAPAGLLISRPRSQRRHDGRLRSARERPTAAS